MVSVNGSANAPAVGSSAGNGAAPSRTTLDYQSFLKLFVEQLKHQDPTAPLDASESLAQLATFSQVEQSVALNGKLDALLSAQSLSQANSLLGRTVTSADGEVTGTIVSVRVVGGGALATLEDGRTVALGDGVSIS